MAKEGFYLEGMEKLVERIAETYRGDSGINFIDAANLPVRGRIIETLQLLLELLFPGYTGMRAVTQANLKFVIEDILSQAYTDLAEQVERAFRHRCRMEKCDTCDCHNMSQQVTEDILNELPVIREMLKEDIQAAFEGDPAAKSDEEIVISYPGIVAIATYRLAHVLYEHEVPLIPRIMTEYAHSITGIDIHPGATIGRRFFIDHGTGVVIGETTIIGDNVKIYQGTTLGALSFRKDKDGRIIKGGKRHPTIEDNVTIYAEATILGDVVIGKDSIIGGNVWIQESVPEATTVLMPKGDLVYKERKSVGKKEKSS
ncbi:MAG: serine O-acetyltransferase [Phycisphaerae bacterium]|nr:serine O-acetyltransferase [Phycisphaerae bacterium]